MSDATNPFAAMMAQMQEMAKTFPAMEAFDIRKFEGMFPTMPKDVMEAMFGNAFNEGGLDARTRLVMQGAQNETAVRQTVRHAVEAGATDQHISETIAMMSMFAGIPATTKAMDLAQAVLKEDKKT